MIDTDLSIIFTVEVIRIILGLGLLILDLKILLPTIKNSSSFYLFGILFFHNMMYLSRAYGIASDQVAIRQNLPALSAFGGAIFPVYVHQGHASFPIPQAIHPSFSNPQMRRRTHQPNSSSIYFLGQRNRRNRARYSRLPLLDRAPRVATRLAIIPIGYRPG